MNRNGNELINEIQRGLGRVEGKLDYLLTIIPDHFKSDEHNFAMIYSRLNKLETKVYGIAAAIGIFSGSIPFIVNYLVSRGS